MSKSYRKLRRKLDEAEAMLARLRVDVLMLALEVKRIEDVARCVLDRPSRVARGVLGMPVVRREQLRLVP
jgi:hypothetical protein